MLVGFMYSIRFIWTFLKRGGLIVYSGGGRKFSLSVIYCDDSITWFQDFLNSEYIESNWAWTETNYNGISCLLCVENLFFLQSIKSLSDGKSLPTVAGCSGHPS